jgi:hypothetical protein
MVGDGLKALLEFCVLGEGLLDCAGNDAFLALDIGSPPFISIAGFLACFRE